MITKMVVAMDAWMMNLMILFITLLLTITTLLPCLLNVKKSKLPPGPLSIPIVSTIRWAKKPLLDINLVFRKLRSKFGPVVSLRISSHTLIFVSDHVFAHRALVQNASIFAGRPPQSEFKRDLLGRYQINAAPYGPVWGLLRRNLMSNILNPSRVALFADARCLVLHDLFDKLEHEARDGGRVVAATGRLRRMVFSIMVMMCFGTRLGDEEIDKIADVQRCLRRAALKANVFNYYPSITKRVFRRRWNALYELRRRHEGIFIPLIRARELEGGSRDITDAYLDSLLEIRTPEEGGRQLTEGEVASLCSEFIAVGADTTATTMEWIMAELVKHQDVQNKLAKEVKGADEIDEAAMQSMPYLTAVILEGLRRHPLSHFGAPHAVTEEIAIDGYTIPKDASVLFMIAEMGWDEKVWEEPMEFRPERFLPCGSGEGVDITGNRGIKMAPFGAGRRICPGLRLAMLHLGYFVANLVREFEWKVVEGEEVDLSEKLEITLAMKNPLRARIMPRSNKD